MTTATYATEDAAREFPLCSTCGACVERIECDCCLNPEDNVPCNICQGEGGWWYCESCDA